MNNYSSKPKVGKHKFSDIKVLIVDDQPEIRAMIREIMSDLGVKQIYEAPNGREALLFIDTDFDVVNFVICDWNMPSMSGVDFLRQVRTVYPDLPFLMLTGRRDKNSVVQAREAGVTAYICKPFSPGQLEEKMRILAPFA